ncbi:MAG: Rne/Rng family ribonuclease [Desulfobacterales bacterium]|jgi:ribonuclease E|nr:Rne/Rng family ribonuclease [Desulfobacterales bacterium]MCK5487155.1 Rne/Rng family ribonuclease [Desulfobacterales bacterium]
MSIKILINAIDPEECRVATVKANKLEEFYIESAAREITQGNIYKGVISRIEPSLQAVFVDYGAERHGFLQRPEIHSDYFQDSESGDHSIDKIVKRGQEIMVQVTKEPFMKKGAMLTTYISLAGRHLVLMPGSDKLGISRKIEDEEERNRLKDLMDKLKPPEGFGLIVRTVGIDSTKTLLSRDLKYLLRLWKTIKQSVMKEPAPALLYRERDLVLRSIRDYFTPEVNEILIDNPSVYQEVRKFIKIISRKHHKIVRLYKGAKPIFTKFEIENQIASIFESRVILKSGGSIVIEQTEAMVSIDVNSGKSTHERSIEKTAFLTNLEAAEEIARQLRLRDLGGLIVIDFIDMQEPKHRSEVERRLRSCTGDDKAKTKVGKISRFGLLEMSRQRIRPSIEFGSYHPCRHCQGKGLVASTETLAVGFLRKLSLETLKPGITSVKGVVPVDVADYLLNKKRKEIAELEERRTLSVEIEGAQSMAPGDSKITFTD